MRPNMRTTPKYPPTKGYRARPESKPYRPQHLVPPPPVASLQAQKVIDRFGGPSALAYALNQLPDPHAHRHRSAVYRWLFSSERGGTDGHVPPKMVKYVKQAARLMGIVMRKEDWEL